MPRRRLIWQLYPAYLVVVVVSIAAAVVYIDHAVRGVFLQQRVASLKARAALIAGRLPQPFPRAAGAELDALVRRLDEEAGARVTLIAPDGVVLSDSEKTPPLDNHAHRPEVVAALAGEVGLVERYSDTMRMEMHYCARPVLDDGRIVGVLRVALPTADVSDALAAIRLRLEVGALAMAALAAAMGIAIFSRVVARPLAQIRASASAFTAGNLTSVIPDQRAEEFGGLSDAVNTMARQLHDQIRTITQQSNEQRAVLASMIEGVVAIDSQERILSLNAAAATFLGVEPARVIGRPIREIVRNTQLQRFVARTLAGSDPVEGDLVLPAEGEDRYLQAHGTVLRDPAGAGIGALVVLNDVTRLRRLENIRRDFVANVSHELRTPVTAIKGSIETLREGAMDDPARAEQFLAILARQADRLNAIIEDLLRLSRIEQENERAEVELAPHRLRDVLQSALSDCQAQAAEREINLRLTCPPDLLARVNAPLLEQAVVNLLDNAIKYSDPGASVDLNALADEREVRIEVRDTGSGIPAEHLPRIFERFYRVDKARSRRLGGTGLGLAIVKHIAQAHRGSISVASTVGKGSVFTLHLPLLTTEERGGK
ncbi:MAG: ATP-binding protein [Planctomycetota bacterium]|nr:ATP-binding protein [Planctomycetota bacterium]